ncbi:PQ loop repeat family protein [Tritrichomonas foetus]|uniref:PQ loop repeat family protein n=1 Tax=Tritrichomonas foetus TaxID=1144522 RepID=A0A1J4KEC2_9EUKA|nr:PQ loop repeat family protein [Tritrichomonas foetus]|eukprot:OHT09264.1 PQ loop repeat family protein [Tritrichomonas foetus]
MSEGDDEFGHGISYEFLTGLIDYKFRFPKVEMFWQIIGLVFFLVNFFSFIPQTTELVTSRSAFGIEPLATFCQSLGHYLLVINLLCFKCLDFVGFFQYPDASAFPRLLTFSNMFFMWIMFLPTIFQTVIYHDREYRETRPQPVIRADWIKAVCACVLLILADIILLLIWLALSLPKGFETSGATKFGEVCGTISTVLEFVFFVPQMYTTCKLQDGGSLSLLMLEIQAPADLANTLYMWLGTGDHWTTWLTVFIDAIEEFTLLGTCLLFNCLRARRLKAAEKERQLTMSLHASMEPEPLSFDKF